MSVLGRGRWQWWKSPNVRPLPELFALPADGLLFADPCVSDEDPEGPLLTPPAELELTTWDAELPASIAAKTCAGEDALLPDIAMADNLSVDMTGVSRPLNDPHCCSIKSNLYAAVAVAVCCCTQRLFQIPEQGHSKAML